MKLVLNEIRIQNVELVWNFDPIANKLVCELPAELNTSIDLTFHDITVPLMLQKTPYEIQVDGYDVLVHGKKLEISNAREFIQKGRYTLDSPGKQVVMISSSTGQLVSSFPKDVLFGFEAKNRFVTFLTNTSNEIPLEAIAAQELEKIKKSIRKNGATPESIAAYLKKRASIIQSLLTCVDKEKSSVKRMLRVAINQAFPLLQPQKILNQVNELVSSRKTQDIEALVRRQSDTMRENLFFMLHHTTLSGGSLLDSPVGKVLLEVLYQINPRFKQTHQALAYIDSLLNQEASPDAIVESLKPIDLRVLLLLHNLIQKVPGFHRYRNLAINELIAEKRSQSPKGSSAQVLSEQSAETSERSISEMGKITQIISKLRKVTENYSEIDQRNKAIEHRVNEYLATLPPEVLAGVYLASETNPIQIMGNEVLMRLLDTAKRERPVQDTELSSSNTQQEVEGALINLVNLVKRYDPVEDNLVDFLQEQPALILNKVSQVLRSSPDLANRGDAILIRAINRISEESSTASELSQSSASSFISRRDSLRSRFSVRSRSSRILFPAGMKPKDLKLESILNKGNQPEPEEKITYFYADKLGLHSALERVKRIHNLPLHTKNSLIQQARAKTNFEISKHRSELMSNLTTLFNHNIDPAWRDASAADADTTETDQLSSYFKATVLEIMAAEPREEETAREWRARRNNLIMKLDVLTSDKSNPKNLGLERNPGFPIQSLKDYLKANPELKETIKNQIQTIDGNLEAIGDSIFARRKPSKRISSKENGVVSLTNLLGSIISQNKIRQEIRPSVKELTNLVVDKVQELNKEFIRRLHAAGAPSNDPIHTAIATLTMYSTGISHESDFYVGNPMAANIERDLNFYIKNLKVPLTKEKIMKELQRLVSREVRQLLSTTYCEELQRAEAMQSDVMAYDFARAESSGPALGEGISLDEVLNKADIDARPEMNDGINRATYMHERGDFLRISRADAEQFDKLGLFTYHSFNTALQGFRKNNALYPIKTELFQELRYLMDTIINPAFAQVGAPEDRDAMRASFKTAIVAIMEALPSHSADEGFQSWADRIPVLLQELTSLQQLPNPDDSSPRAKLQRYFNDNPEEAVQLRRSLARVAARLEKLGNNYFDNMMSQELLASAIQSRCPSFESNKLFGDLLQSAMQQLGIKEKYRVLAREKIKRNIITAIERMQARFDGYNLDVNHERQFQLVKTPVSKLNALARFLRHDDEIGSTGKSFDDFFLGGEVLAKFELGLADLLDQIPPPKNELAVSQFVDGVSEILIQHFNDAMESTFADEIAALEYITNPAPTPSLELVREMYTQAGSSSQSRPESLERSTYSGSSGTSEPGNQADTGVYHNILEQIQLELDTDSGPDEILRYLQSYSIGLVAELWQFIQTQPKRYSSDVIKLLNIALLQEPQAQIALENRPGPSSSSAPNLNEAEKNEEPQAENPPSSRL